jgi:hypothetical protein
MTTLNSLWDFPVYYGLVQSKVHDVGKRRIKLKLAELSLSDTAIVIDLPFTPWL